MTKQRVRINHLPPGIAGVSYPAENGGRPQAPKGEYTMEPTEGGIYHFSGDGLPSFNLNLREVVTYRDAKAIKPMPGEELKIS